MSERQIGRVVSVDNFRVFVRLDDDLTSTHKSGLHDLYEVARINSYLIIPVGADRIVALITRVKMQEEQEFERDRQSISLPSSARYVTATMLGTIEKTGQADRYVQGVYNFPVLDNPVWYVTADDLNNIFDYKSDSDIDYSKDFYLPIGKSPAFPDYSVKICPDQFFVKHAAVLGNTGSGKSCTMASILKGIFQYKFKLEKDDQENTPDYQFLNNAHFIIFDTNGEYKNAFISEGEVYKRINALHVDNKGIKVPYWFMNWEDFNYLFEPSPGTQAPILKRAIGLAKNVIESENKGVLSTFLLKGINGVLECAPDDLKKRTGFSDYGNWRWKADNEILKLSKALHESSNETIIEIAYKLEEIGSQENFCDTNIQSSNIAEINILLNKHIEEGRQEQITAEKNIDLPTWFCYIELVTKFIDAAIDEQESSSTRLKEYLSTLRLRLESYLNDQRIALPLMLNSEKEFQKSLVKFMSFIIGDFYRFYNSKETDVYPDYFTKVPDEFFDREKSNQITILDLSLVPFDVLENLTGLIGRLLIEFVEHFKSDQRGEYPIVIILEEAQNYIPEKYRRDRESIAKKVFERIAREGRKYGVSLVVSSQRPSELSRTVLSQCNSFIVHRLQNPDDQKYVRGLVSSANNDILDQLPILPQQHAIIMGDCVRTPVQTRINDISPRPKSNNPEFVQTWLNNNEDKINYEEICNRWLSGEK